MNGKKTKKQKSGNINNNKRSQGEIVATVLLILLVIVASVILLGFVVPLVNTFLSGGKCNDYIGMVSITNSNQYTCYDQVTKTLVLQIKVDGKLEKEKARAIKGLKIVVDSAGEDSLAFGIYPPSANPPLSVVMSNGGNTLVLPEPNQERKYNITNINIRPNSTTVYPEIENGQTCAGDKYTIDHIPYCQ
jgi:hypothetical protein